MRSINQYLQETELKKVTVPFVLHEHHPRSGTKHYDLRFVNPKDPKRMYSFAGTESFLKDLKSKALMFKTRPHDIRWLDLKSYRLKEIDKILSTI